MEEKIVCAWRRPEKQEIARQMRRIMTPAESRLWDEIRNNRLVGLHFRRQQVISGFIVDFYCRAARLVIECDGSVHDAQEEYDRERDRIIAAANLHILRFSNSRILHDTAKVLTEIQDFAKPSANKSDIQPASTLTLP